jgi:hypothetical protein
MTTVDKNNAQRAVVDSGGDQTIAALSHRAGIMTASSRRQHEFIAFDGASRTRTGGDFGP